MLPCHPPVPESLFEGSGVCVESEGAGPPEHQQESPGRCPAQKVPWGFGKPGGSDSGRLLTSWVPLCCPGQMAGQSALSPTPGTWRGERRVTSSGGGGGRSWERNAVPSAPRIPSQPGPGPGPPEKAEADGEQQLSGQGQGLGLRCPSPNSVLCASQRLTDSPSHASGSRLEHG